MLLLNMRMDCLVAPPKMQRFKNQTVESYGYDKTGSVSYTLDSIGFRNSAELAHSIAVVGNTSSFGLGVEYAKTYASMINAYNASYCAVLHENHDHLSNITYLANHCDTLVIQINNLDRRRNDEEVSIGNDPSWCIKHFEEYFEAVNEITKNNRVLYMYWDEIEYNLPKSITQQFLIHNKLHLDNPGGEMSKLFGIKTHHALAQVINYALR